MKVPAVHPGPLMYTKIFLRLEPLGLELVAGALRQAGHDLRLIDLQVEDHAACFRMLDDWQPDAVAFSCNHLPNVPEVVDLAKATRARAPGTFIFVGGHCLSFIARDLLPHAKGAVDCVLKGEGEAGAPRLLAALPALHGRPLPCSGEPPAGQGPGPEHTARPVSTGPAAP